MPVFKSIKIGNVVDKFRLLLVTNLNLTSPRLADPDSGSASLPLALHLHPGPPFLIKLRGNEVFLRCAVLLLHSPVKYIISNSITKGEVDKSLQTKKEVFVLIF